jgi:hypothetical protein
MPKEVTSFKNSGIETSDVEGREAPQMLLKGILLSCIICHIHLDGLCLPSI